MKFSVELKDPRTVRGWLGFVALLLLAHAGVAFLKISWLAPMHQEVVLRSTELALFNANPFARFDRAAMGTGYRVDCEAGCGPVEQLVILRCARAAGGIEREAGETAAQVYLSGCVKRAGHDLKPCAVTDADCLFLGRRSLWRPWALAELTGLR